MILHEGFDYPFSRVDPYGDHIDPPSVAIYETVVVKGPDGTAQPGLADRWTVSPDRREWRFHIPAGRRFHSGDPCDAPAVCAALTGLRWELHGGRQHWYWDPVDQMWAADAETLAITLHHPYARVPSLLWGTHTAVYNRARRDRDPDASGYAYADGTGPFRLVSYRPERVVAERWPGYPGSPAPFLATGGPARLDRIEWTALLDPRERVAALERGEIACMHGPDYADVARLEEDPRFAVTRFSQASNAYLALNWERADLGFDDLRVRRALSLAIDRGRLVREALLGYGTPTYGPVAARGEFYDPAVERGRRPDPAAARRLLEAAGWTLDADGVRANGGRRLAFACVIQDDAIHRAIATGLQGQLREVGVVLDLTPVRTFQAFYAALVAGPASFINKWLWQDPVDAAIGFTATWGSPRPNWQHASVPALDDAYRAWLWAETPAALQAAATQVQLVAADTLPYIPLLTPDDVWVCSRRVHGWQPAPAILYPFYHRVTVEDER